MEVATLFVKISAKAEEFEKSMSGVEAKLNNMSKKFDKMGKNLTLKVTTPILGMGAAFSKAAMDLEATEAKYNTVFEGMTNVADDFITKFQELTPATKAEARSMASGMQDLLVPMGFVKKEATAMTSEFMHVTGALANFNSGTHTAQQVANAMQGAITGQYESLKALGIQLDVTTVKEKAVEMGLAATTDEVTKQMQSQVVLAEVYAQSGDALNAYTEKNLDAKTKMALVKTEAIDVAASFGEVLLPTITKVIDGLDRLVSWFGGLSEEQQKNILIVGAVVASIGPLLIIVGKVIAIFGILTTTVIPALGAAFTFLTGPIGIAILAIGAAVAAGIWLYKNWDMVRVKITDIWQSIVSAVIGLINNMIAGIENGFNWGIRAVNSFVDKINYVIGGLNKVPGVDIPLVPKMGEISLGKLNIPQWEVDALMEGFFDEDPDMYSNINTINQTVNVQTTNATPSEVAKAVKMSSQDLALDF